MRATAALVGGDPVVTLEVVPKTRAARYEFLVLRLAPNGETQARLALDPRAAWGERPVTQVRVASDGKLYELRTSPTFGVRIARYTLGATLSAPPTTTHAGAGGAPTPSTVTPPPATSPPTPTVAPPVAAQPAGRSVLLLWLAAIGTGMLVGAVGAWAVYRRRHPRGPGRPVRSRPAH